ncbi:amino acid transporter [Thermoplasma volcanium GSS1]|uniref:Amino acid transporter n=1 Tax=Thermoplasma volcanium (strain ATCC 51530 / DSM 4299 / JCM 9571 / NBRC 15438 / GSS1) TaxID=273116 RepID=Q97AU1_THEVO|nr:APC family permease [Thermoplasma volcanium]BAB59860.1 amino acid transporter [Thermoplasma volcanium GSS1]
MNDTSAGHLKSNAVGFWPLLGQAIAMISPLGAVAATMTGSASIALGSLPLAYLIAIFAVLFWINTPYQYSKKIASAGGFYTYNRNGAGQYYGSISGYVLFFSYYMTYTNAILFITAVFIPGLFEIFFGITLTAWIWIPVLIAIGLLVLLPAYLGIEGSTKYSLASSIIQIALLVILSLTIIVIKGPANTLEPFTPKPAGGFGPVFVGMILAIFSMSGSSAVVSLGEEAKQPKRNIRNALLISFLVTGVVFVLTSYALTIGWGISNMNTFAQSNPAAGLTVGQGVPGIIEALKYMGMPMAIAMMIFAVNSLYTGSLAPLNSAARMFFAMSRDGIAPKVFAKTHGKYKTPHVALVFIAFTGILVSLIAGLAMGPFNGFLYLVTASAVALFIGHIMTDISLPVAFKKFREFSVLKHAVLPAISLVLLLIGIYYSFFPPTYPTNIAIITAVIFMVAVAIGINVYLRNGQRKMPTSYESDF